VRHKVTPTTGGKKTLSEALNQGMKLEVADIASGMPPRAHYMKARAFWRRQTHPHGLKRQPTAFVLVLWEYRCWMLGK
jgi:hypothetical protein